MTRHKISTQKEHRVDNTLFQSIFVKYNKTRKSILEYEIKYDLAHLLATCHIVYIAI